MGKAIPTARLKAGTISPMVLDTSWARRGFRPTGPGTSRTLHPDDEDDSGLLL
jgi:hypothetical protein